jgi:hypothetical protein
LVLLRNLQNMIIRYKLNTQSKKTEQSP